MARIIPWSLPSIQGGAVGGYTPKVEPAPEPVIPYNYPYILDNIQIVAPTLSLKMGKQRMDTTLKYNSHPYERPQYQVVGNNVNIGVSGVEIVDTQNVSSVIAKVHVSGTIKYKYTVFAEPTSITVQDKSVAVDTDVSINISSIMNTVGGSVAQNANVGGTFETLIGIYNTSANSLRQSSSWTGQPAVSIDTPPTMEVVSIMVYNDNGVVIQEWYPSEEEEEE